MSFDLHTHSTASDGTEPPAHVVAEAARAGLRGIALTDHDSTAGWAEALAAAEEHGIGLIPGMEITSKTAAASVHMLSYLHDPEHPGLLELNAATRGGRVERAKHIAERLAEDFPISWELVLEQVEDGASIGRPHIADALVAAGVVRERSEAFDKYIHRSSKYYVGQDSPHPTEVVRRVREAGGVPVIAHAMAGKRGNTLDVDELEELVEAGMLGVEIWHRDNTEEGKQILLDLARRHDLIITGSSDYHGVSGKPNTLGENTTDPEHVARLLEAASGTDAYNIHP
ncbi:PHP domain-containing protein [Nesterenkonia sp. MY13]|uniref:PHP domain-containing protein n=1 Tax=Nesterenkonia sedimenti TaxID=1463632 RepID=A0A7X8TJF0_9MICC|nr:PHP domain-containing protein [Nesterenkonia sedimenti]NLS09600.1 PHP domain-containing protein [Nesterenkonia sedimenti]